MFRYDFSNHQNRYIRLSNMPPEYYASIQQTAREDPFYPLWHIAPICGLLNDPCGLVQRDGVHYLFHQWFPAGPVHGLKHWYLLTTRDFIHYTAKGAVLRPEHPFDSHGCYTGMAFPEEDGVTVYYTGIRGEEQMPSICCGSLSDGQITDCRSIICQDPKISTAQFRDPCAFEREGTRYLLVGAQDLQGEGRLLLYHRDSEGRFQFDGPVGLGDRQFGYMLECPNYFETEGEGVLFFSPMGIQSRDQYEFRNVFSVVYSKGELLDVSRREFRSDGFYEMDKGFDFYAPQTYRDEQGRQILFGWLGNSKSEYPTDWNHWAHMLTLPRQISWRGERMVQAPLTELGALRREPQPLTSCMQLPEPSFDMEGEAEGRFAFELSNQAGDSVRFTADEAEYCLDRGGMTFLYAERFGTRRYARRLTDKQTVRILLDRSSLEIFVDDGQTVFTSRIFLSGPHTLRVSGIRGTLYRMGPIQIRRDFPQP